MSVVGCRFEGVTIAVEAPDDDDLAWLAAFLDCGFERAAPGGATRHVAYVTDAHAYDRLRERARPGGLPLVTAFADETGPMPLERWSGPDPGDLFHDPTRPVFYHVSPDGARVRLVAREPTRKTRNALMRVVRELAMGPVVATGGVLVHAAAVATDGGVVVVSGPKRAGKTTLLLALLEGGGTRFVAADRCVLRRGGDGVSVRGLPTLVSIRTDAFGRSSRLGERLARIRPDRAGAAARERPRVSLTPPEFCELMACGTSPGGPLAALVFPVIDEPVGGPPLRRLDAAGARARFHAGLFRARADRVLGDVFVGGLGAAAARSPADLAAPLAPWIAQTVPCFEYRLPRGAPPGPEDGRALLARCAAP